MVWQTFAALPAAAQAANDPSEVCAAVADPLAVPFFALQRSNLDAALAACTAAHTADPDNAAITAFLGRIHHSQGQVDVARSLYEAAAAQGSGLALYNLAYLTLETQGAQGEIAALDLVQRAADAGYLPAQTELGLRLRDGAGLPPDPAEGRRLIEGAADGGLPFAMTVLATMHLSGKGAERDPALGLKWLRQAALAGDAEAAARWGILLMNGEHLPKNETEAVLWLAKGAEGGIAFAMMNLRHLLAEGRGTETNYREAARWALAAAVAGDTQVIDGSYKPRAGTVLEMHLHMAWSGHYKGLKDGKFTGATRGAMQRLAAEANLAQFLEDADRYREERDTRQQAALEDLGRAFADAYLESQIASAATRAALGPKSDDPERLVIDHAPSDPMSPEWDAFITGVRAANREATIPGLDLGIGDLASMDGAWVRLQAFDAQTGIAYFSKGGGEGRLYSVGSSRLARTDLAPEGDRSADEPRLLLDVEKADKAEVARWRNNLSIAFANETLNGLEAGDEAALTGLLSDEYVSVAAADPARRTFYIVRAYKDRAALYSVGADHIVSQDGAKLRDLGRGGVTLGVFYCLYTGSCAN